MDPLIPPCSIASPMLNSLNTLLLLAFAFSIGINIGMYSSFQHVDFSSRLHALKKFTMPLFRYRSNKTPPPLADSYIRNQMHSNLSSEVHDPISVKNNHKVPLNLNSIPPLTATSRPAIPPMTPQENRNIHTPPKHDSLGRFERFLVEGGQLPIVLLTCNRPQYLQATLESLRNVRGLDFKNLLVSQDGTMMEIEALVRETNLKLVQNTARTHLRHEGAQRIAFHYKFTLSKAFETFPDAPGVIVIEDDLLFSPDFYDFFQSNAPILDRDSSVLALSAWNDNGFKGRVGGPYDLLRTTFFPGLGWLLSRSLYQHELEAAWPRDHWDHWLRSAEISKKREVVYPFVPRSYHNGVSGTFMNVGTHNKYFKDIAYNTDASVSWKDHAVSQSAGSPVPLYMTAAKNTYELRIESLLQTACIHLHSLSSLRTYNNSNSLNTSFYLI